MNLLSRYHLKNRASLRTKVLVFVVVSVLLIMIRQYTAPHKLTRLTGVWQHPSISLIAPRKNFFDKNPIYKEFANGKYVSKTDSLLLNWINNIHCNDHCINNWCPELYKAKLSPQCQYKGLLIIDSGAHIGDTSLWVAQFAKQTKQRVKVVAIDPNPDKIDFINRMIRLNHLEDYIITVTSAVGDKNITGKELTGINSGSNWIEPSEKGNVSIRKIDDIIDSLDLKDYAVGFLHLDVEGYEYNALLGSEKIISRFKPIVVTEVFHERVFHRSIRDDINNVMKNHGFTRSEKIFYDWGDTIFYNKQNTEQVDLLKQLFML